MVCSVNVIERILLVEVNKVIFMVKDVLVEDDVIVCFRCWVMKYFRNGGYFVVICKLWWDNVGIFFGGVYEYIDVIFEGVIGKSERIIIDIDFRI